MFVKQILKIKKALKTKTKKTLKKGYTYSGIFIKPMLILLTILIFSPAINSQNKKGIIDLTKADFSKVNSICGQWEFYWSELLTPQEINYRKTTPDYIRVNSEWNGYNYHGRILGGDGYATYKVKILLPKTGQYCIKLHQILSAYKVWINGKIVDSVGKVAKTKEKAIPHVETNEINFITESDTVDLVIQVSNFSHRAGGIQEKLEFGTPDVIERNTTNNLLYTFFIIGAELIFALYFLFSFFFRQKDLAFIFFSITIFLAITFELVNNEMILLRFFPQISFEVQKKIDFLSNYLRLTFFILFLWYTFKEYKIINKLSFLIIFSISVILVASIIFTPCKIYSYTLPFFLILGTLSFFYFLIIAGIGVLKKTPHIIYSFLGLLALNIAAINDALFNLNIVHTTYLLNVGLLIFFIGHSVTLSLKFSQSVKSANLLAQKFRKYEKILEEFLKIYSFDLEKILKIIDNFVNSDYLELNINNNVFICECKKSFDNSIICGKQEKNFSPKIDDYLLNNILKSQKTIKTNKNNKHILSIPIVAHNSTKAVLYFEKNNRSFNNNTIEILEMLIPQLSTFIDNYNFYINLENLNKNLETIIEKRTQLAFEQKLELEVKKEELSEKIKELKQTAQIVEDLNTELNEQKENLAIKNKQLEIHKKQILIQKKILEEKEAYIHESIAYAKKIQKIFFSSAFVFPFKEYLFCFSAKDIISGDFVTAFNKENYFLIALIDTTGINVSASFLNVLLQSLLDEILTENPAIISDTARILKKLRYQYLKSLDISAENRFIKDSFDISLCSIEKKTGNTIISTIGQPIIIQKGKEQIFIEPDNFTIGGHQSNFDKDFSVKKINLHAGDSIFLFSDGYYNQIGEKNKKKMGIQYFCKILEEIYPLSADKQNQILVEKFNNWKGNLKRVDDYTVVGFKFFPSEK